MPGNLKKLILFLIIGLLLTALSGCSGTKYKTKPDYNTTEQVTLNFMNSYMQGNLDQAMQNVAEEAVLSTDSGQMKGKATIAELLQINIDKQNKMEIADKKKIDNSKITLTINNTIPLFQLAGVDVVKTKRLLKCKTEKSSNGKSNTLKNRWI